MPNLKCCEICNRLHEPDQPCPLRIANVYTMRLQAFEKLTEPDKAWIKAHPGLLRSILDTVEDTIADMM